MTDEGTVNAECISSFGAMTICQDGSASLGFIGEYMCDVSAVLVFIIRDEP